MAAPPLRVLLGPEGARSAFAGYQKVLQSLSPSELLSELTRVNAALQTEAHQSVTDLLRERVMERDQLATLGPTSTSTGDPSRSTDRGASATRSPSPPPSAFELLARGEKLGPKLVARLVAASARARAEGRGG